MLIEHRGSVPEVHPSAYVAPTAVLCGAVRIGPDARVLFGAVLTGEDGQVSVGASSVVMENAAHLSDRIIDEGSHDQNG